MSEDYEREKLGNAVDALAASAAPIQKRLEYAFMAMHTLMMHKLTDPERQAEYDAIIEKLTADKSNEDQGHVATTCARLSDDAAIEIAQAIVDLNARLSMNRVWHLEDEIDKLKRGNR